MNITGGNTMKQSRKRNTGHLISTTPLSGHRHLRLELTGRHDRFSIAICEYSEAGGQSLPTGRRIELPVDCLGEFKRTLDRTLKELRKFQVMD